MSPLSIKFHWIFSAAPLHSANQHWIDMRYEHCAILGVGHEWQCLSCIKRPKSKSWELSTTLKINNVGQKLRVVAWLEAAGCHNCSADVNPHPKLRWNKWGIGWGWLARVLWAHTGVWRETSIWPTCRMDGEGREATSPKGNQDPSPDSHTVDQPTNTWQKYSSTTGSVLGSVWCSSPSSWIAEISDKHYPTECLMTSGYQLTNITMEWRYSIFASCAQKCHRKWSLKSLAPTYGFPFKWFSGV